MEKINLGVEISANIYDDGYVAIQDGRALTLLSREAMKKLIKAYNRLAETEGLGDK